MGRIKTQLIKRHTQELFKKYGDFFTDNFEENKKLVEKYMEVGSKKFRNVVAGYITRLVKHKEVL